MTEHKATERDYPVGHPAAPDYAGEHYTPPKAPHAEDFPEGHPARGGANCPADNEADVAKRELEEKREKGPKIGKDESDTGGPPK